MVFNYPTLAEAYRIAAFNALNKIYTDGEIDDPPEDPEAEAVVTDLIANPGTTSPSALKKPTVA
jgi:hypothetical protein